jgi:hypothetical protein
LAAPERLCVALNAFASEFLAGAMTAPAVGTPGDVAPAFGTCAAARLAQRLMHAHKMYFITSFPSEKFGRPRAISGASRPRMRRCGRPAFIAEVEFAPLPSAPLPVHQLVAKVGAAQLPSAA